MTSWEESSRGDILRQGYRPRTHRDCSALCVVGLEIEAGLEISVAGAIGPSHHCIFNKDVPFTRTITSNINFRNVGSRAHNYCKQVSKGGGGGGRVGRGSPKISRKRSTQLRATPILPNILYSKVAFRSWPISNGAPMVIIIEPCSGYHDSTAANQNYLSCNCFGTNPSAFTVFLSAPLHRRKITRRNRLVCFQTSQS